MVCIKKNFHYREAKVEPPFFFARATNLFCAKHFDGGLTAGMA